MSNTETLFHYQPILNSHSLAPKWSKTQLEANIESTKWRGKDWLCFDGNCLSDLASLAMEEINHYLRSSHLEQWRAILDDLDASPNDRYVALELLKNANISAAGALPMCQDTGTAIIVAHKGARVYCGSKDEENLSRGIFDAYQRRNFRYSQVSPLTMFEEKNTKTNLPAQIDILHGGDPESYHFIFIAKGGGSANKSFLYQESPALLDETRLLAFVREKMFDLGTSACPPYHLALVVGGTSAEMTMKTAKLASCRALDHLPTQGNSFGAGFRDLGMEKKLLAISREIGIGAQFGGKYFCLDTRVIRLPRHGASLPIALSVSCSADRQIEAKIDKHGVFLEELEHDPARFLPVTNNIKVDQNLDEAPNIDLKQSMPEICAALSACSQKGIVLLNGPMIVARDSAHRRIRQAIERGEKIPEYMINHPIYYAGPAKTPTGMISGSFGPTTASRMDPFVEEFQSLGASRVMVAKGNRTRQVSESCKKHGGFYLGSIGGPAAVVAERSIKKVECIDFADLGMEAVWKIEVERFPVFVIIDDKGNDFFQTLRGDKIGR